MAIPKLSPEEYAKIVEAHKPHLVEIENAAQELQFGTLEVKIEVRAGIVTKMQFWSGRTWLKDKAIS